MESYLLCKESASASGMRGIFDQQMNYSIDVSPNPTSGMVKINLENTDPGDINLQVFNVHGALIKQANFYGSNLIELNLSEEESGVYFLTISNSDGIGYQKIVLTD